MKNEADGRAQEMSVYHRLTAVRDAPLDPSGKLLLFTLLSYADRNGDAWPSHKRLCADLRLSERQVRRLLTELRHAGVVISRMRGTMRMLWVDFEKLRALPTSTSSPKGDAHVPHAGRNGTPMGDIGVRSWGTPVSARTTIEQSIVHSFVQKRASNDGTNERKKDAFEKTEAKNETTPTSKSQKQLPPDQLDLFIEGWNRLPDGIAPRCTKRSATLVSGWKRAISQPEVADALGDVPKLLDAIRHATFLHGQPWFRLPWLFGKDRSGEWNVVKIVEGAYRDSPRKPKSAPRRPIVYDPAIHPPWNPITGVEGEEFYEVEGH